jgi:hypothetical protein
MMHVGGLWGDTDYGMPSIMYASFLLAKPSLLQQQQQDIILFNECSDWILSSPYRYHVDMIIKTMLRSRLLSTSWKHVPIQQPLRHFSFRNTPPVKIRLSSPPIFNWRRVGRNLLILIPIWYFIPISVSVSTVDPDEQSPGDGQAAAVDNNKDANSIQDVEDLPSLLFIPITTAREVDPIYYTNTDPEWQMFVEFSKDKEEHKQMIASLSRSVRDVVSKSLQDFEANVGQLDIDKGKSWLDISFPYGPPKQYEITG